MKKYVFAFLGLFIILFAVAEVLPTKFYVWVNGLSRVYTIGNGEMVYGDGTLTIDGTTYSLSEIDSITFGNETVVSDTVYVTYNGSTASVSPVQTGISVDINGADVTLTNEITDRELTFVLSGTSDSGSLVYNGNYKTTIRLNGLTLTGSTAEAINIKDGKRIALELAEGTTNTLSDAATDGGQKAAFYTKGHLEVSGNGTLQLTGNVKHALASKEYLLIKKTAGTIQVRKAANDGIHAGQYVQVNGGTLLLSDLGGDGIQAEMASDQSEDDGKIIIKGGTLNIAVSSADCAALKSDSTLHVKEGSITIQTTGAADKGLKSKGDVAIEGGTLDITQSGSYIVENMDPSYTTGIKANGDVRITGGTLTLTNTAEAGKGISADGNLSISEADAAVTLKVTANGAGGTMDTSKNVDSDNSSTTETTSYKVYVSVPSSSSQGGMGGGMGGNQNNKVWSNVYLYDNSGTKIAQLTSTYTVTASNGTSSTFYVYDFGKSDSGTYYFASDNYSGQGGRNTYAIKSATFSGPTSGSDYFYTILSSYTTSSNTRTYSLSNVTSTYANATITSSGSTGTSSGTVITAAALKSDGNLTIAGGTITLTSTGSAAKSVTCDGVLSVSGGDLTITNSGAGISTGDGYSAKGLTSDGSIALTGGNIRITLTGTGGKGIKSDGTLVVGNEQDGTGPTLTVSTSGSSLTTSGNSSSGGWGGMGNQSGNTSSAKAIKAVGTIYIYGGTLEVTTATDGAEGLESKSDIYIEGGQHYFKCYDDCINASGCIYFNGGVTVCYGTGNDAVDSNAGKTGAITIGNGTIFAYTTKGSPEEGLDCDNNSYIRITGTGIAVSAGSSQGGGSSSNSISNAKQGYAFVTSSISYASGRYYTLADASGNNLVTFSFAASCSSTLGLFTAKGMTSGSTYTVKYSTVAPTDATTSWHGLYLGSSHTGSTSVTSFTAK